MVNTNKILTVSYGTFSCTLEGFEDSFGTMKAIAEYFRDLAADDRYFGAEPPTPDAEMLARIAEREIARRVEAQIENQNIHLRADPGSILPVPARDEDRAEETAPAPVTEKPAKPAPAPAVAKPATEEPTAEEPVSETEQDREDFAGLSDMLTAEDEAPAEEPTAAEPAAEEPLADESLDWTEEDEAAAFFGEAEVQQPAAQPRGIEGVDTESVAAKLMRIRAVVSQEQRPEADTVFSEDEHAEDFADDFLADAHEDIEAALAADDAAEAARAAAAEDQYEESTAEELYEDTSDEDQYEDTATEDETVESDTLAALISRYGAAGEAASEDVLDAGADTEHAFVATDEEDEVFADLAEDVPPAEAAEEDEAEHEAAVRARVIKMKRADFEAAIASGDFEEDLAEDTPEPLDEAADDSSLSPEDEADLLRELAAVEAEIQAEAAQPAEDEAFAEFEDEVEEEDAPIDLAEFASDEAFGEDKYEDEDEVAEARVTTHSPFEKAGADQDMERMFDKAASEMDEEAGKGRRSAIAHLRAAVAAAKAEEGAGGKLRTHAPDSEVYRDDLDSVVRPRRPEASRSHTRRPDAQRPAPLKLVAEQRIDLDQDDHRQPIRPRRVSASAAEMVEETAASSSEFADYAESVGANTLPELLEAAAAYLSFVEGREQFSRPQLMTQVRQADLEEFSREDGLRSFGQLLREGKIEKIAGGRFKASDSISYRPGARYAGE